MPATVTRTESAKRIAELNDVLRTTFVGGQVMITAGVHALSPEVQAQVLMAVRTFDDFTPDNDPYHEPRLWHLRGCRS